MINTKDTKDTKAKPIRFSFVSIVSSVLKVAVYTAGEIDVIRKSSIRIGGTSAVPGLS